MSVKALAEYTQYSRYAKYNPELKRRETWNEQVERVFKMHETQLGEDKLSLIKEEFDFAKELVKKKMVLGSQRALQFGGSPILNKNAKIYNCTVSYVDRVDLFKECMYLLLCGCGVGFSVQTHHVNKLPNLVKRDKGEETFVIPDSIEGWSDAIGVLMQSYFDDQRDYKQYDYDVEYSSFSGKKINFDYSLIRPEGSAISWGGKAPGPEGLRNAINNIQSLIDDLLSKDEYRLRSIDAYDIIMHSSDAVISGGIRRSATICLFSPEDEEMAKAKTGDWFIKNPQRGRSNNSALLIRDETSKEQFSKLMKSVKEFGEPGFVWSDSKEALYNPCLDGETMVTTDKGEVKLKTIVDNPNDYKVLSYNEEIKSLEFQTLKGGIKTKENTNMIKVEFDDGTFINLTPDHKVYTENRGYIQASELTENDDIISIDDTTMQDENSEIEVTEQSYLDQSKWTNRIIEQHSIV